MATILFVGIVGLGFVGLSLWVASTAEPGEKLSTFLKVFLVGVVVSVIVIGAFMLS